MDNVPIATTKDLRSFGLLVGAVFIIIGVWPTLLHSGALRLWALLPGILLVVFGLIWPPALRFVYRGWMAIGLVLGWINTRIILGIIFYGLMTPVGLFMRARGKDFMRKLSVQGAETYRVNRSPRPPDHLKRQF